MDRTQIVNLNHGGSLQPLQVLFYCRRVLIELRGLVECDVRVIDEKLSFRVLAQNLLQAVELRADGQIGSRSASDWP